MTGEHDDQTSITAEPWRTCRDEQCHAARRCMAAPLHCPATVRHDNAPQTTAEPDVLNDLDEMWPVLAGAEPGKQYTPGEIAAILLLAAVEIRRLREKAGELLL